MSSRASSRDSAMASGERTFEDPSPPSYHAGPPLTPVSPLPQTSAPEPQPNTPPAEVLREKPIGRHVFEVTLAKEEGMGIGLTIVGGEATNSLDLGIFVKSVYPGGPAHRDGRVRPGDRLIAIGGTSLEGKQHHEAVALIRDGGPSITLLVSQMRPPMTIKRKDDADVRPSGFFDHGAQDPIDKRGSETFDVHSDLDAANLVDGSSAGFEHSLLRYDDHIHEQNHVNDNVCNSDEEHYSLHPAAFTEQWKAPPNSHSHSQHQTFLENGSAIVPDKEIPVFGSNALSQSSPVPVKPVRKKHRSPRPQDELQQQVSKEPPFEIHPARPEDSLLTGLPDEDQLDLQLSSEGLEWPQHPQAREEESLAPAPPPTNAEPVMYASEGLVAGEHEDLQILGDIAALEAGDSSSDSDFETAVKNTIEGTGLSKVAAGMKVVNAVSPTVGGNPGLSGVPTSVPDVMYEVLLEKQGDSLGIVPCFGTDPGFASEQVFIKEILPGSSAEQGRVLAPGDRLLKIGGESVEGIGAERLHRVLQNAPPLCPVKVARTAHRDALLTGKLGALRQPTAESEPGQIVSNNPERRPQAYPSNVGFQPIQNPSGHAPLLKDQAKLGSLAKLIHYAPKEVTQPLDDQRLPIAPAPPPLALSLEGESEYNTQSDVDSDVLDSSRSELEDIYRNAERFVGGDTGLTPRVEPIDVEGYDLSNIETQAMMGYPRRTDYTDEISESSQQSEGGFSKHLAVLKNDLDERLRAEVTTTDEDYQSNQSRASSVDSVIESPLKAKLESLDPAPLQPMRTEVSSPRKSLNDDLSDTGPSLVNLETTSEEDEASLSLSFGPADSERVSLAPSEMSTTIKDLQETVARLKVREEVDSAQLDPFEPELMKVTLCKVDKSFGFTVAGGVHTGGCFVKQIVGDPARSDGTLRPGDKIVQVNSKDTSMLGHKEAVSLLRAVPEEVTLHLLRYPSSRESQRRLVQMQNEAFSLTHDLSDSKDPRQQAAVQDLIKSLNTPKAIIKPYGYEEEVDRSNQEQQLFSDEAGDSETEVGSSVLQVDLSKPAPSQQESNTVLGLGLIDGVRVDQQGVYIHRIRRGGVAHADGRLKPGDRILQANGVSMEGKHQGEVATFLKEQQGTVLITVSRSPTEWMKVKRNLKESSESQFGEGDASDDDITSLVESAKSVLGEEEEQGFTDTPADLISQPTKHYATQAELPTQQGSLPPSPPPEQSPEEFPPHSFQPVSPAIVTMSALRPYHCPRTLDVPVPVVLSEAWLSDLPLLKVPEDQEAFYDNGLLQSLADLAESGEPCEEFKNLRQLKEESSKDVGQLPEHRSKNRYRNVLPYDKNRVVLRGRVSDYINASYIRMEVGEAEEGSDLHQQGGNNSELCYIACQGPVLETCADFWHMLWQEHTTVVVMLTQVSEGGKVKCHAYWPTEKDEPITFDDGGLMVSLERAYTVDEFSVFDMVMQRPVSGEDRKITLLQFTAWPDHGAPQSALPLLKLIQVMHLLEQGSPAVVHCSAGIGRTGALIAVDAALHTMERAAQFDLYDIVRQLRSQRHGMIQTTEQYLFCYTACMEALLSIEHGLERKGS